LALANTMRSGPVPCVDAQTNQPSSVILNSTPLLSSLRAERGQGTGCSAHARKAQKAANAAVPTCDANKKREEWIRRHLEV